MSIKGLVIFLFVAIVVACGSSSNTKKPDAAIDALDSFCGHPGDTGNDIGVGKYCNTLSDCNGNKMATLCATLGNAQAHFCTKTCPMGSTDQCGMNATCVCQGGSCGCTPNSCLGSGSAN